MSLRVWLPLTGHLDNQGLSDLAFVPVGTTTVVDNNGKLGKCYSNSSNTAGGLISDKAIDLGTTVSMCCWFKYTSLEASSNLGGGLVAQHCYTDNTGLGITIKYVSSTTGYISCSTGTGSSRTYNTYCGTTLLQANTWYHAALTYDGTTIRLYLNGVMEKSVTYAQKNKNNQIGIFAWSVNGGAIHGDYKLNGSLNDVRVYDHALSLKEIKEISKGLVCHYTLGSAFVEPTTNLANRLSSTCYNGATGKYNYGTNTDMYKDTNVYEGKLCDRVRMGTDGLSAWPFVFFNNIHPAQDAYKTLSFDFFPTAQAYLVFYTYNGSASTSYSVDGSPMTSGSQFAVTPNKWNHVVLTLKGTSDKTSGYGYAKIGLAAHTSSTANYWLFANIQVEDKDHATGYTDDTRSDNIVYDSSGYNYHGTSSGISVSSDTPKYSVSTVFDANTDTIKITPCYSLNQVIDKLSVSIWFKTNTMNSTAPNLWSLGANWFARVRLASTTALWYYLAGTSSTYSTSPTTLTDNVWHHTVFTFNSGVVVMYLDGAQIGTTDHSSTKPTLTVGDIDWYLAGYRANSENFIGGLSDFRIYSTAISADDVKALYQVGASIDKSGNMYAYEFNEV